jgi:enoyl-CoA hydratase
MSAGYASRNSAAFITFDALLEAALADWAWAPHSGWGGHSSVLVELNSSAARIPWPEREAIVEWLSRQTCPVVGITADGIDHPQAFACDLVADAEEAGDIVKNIESAPLAAMVLIQLLRCTATLGVESALTVESLAYSTLQAGPEFGRWLAESGPTHKNDIADHGAPVLVERRGSCVNLRLNRPEKRNALSARMRDALVEALELVAADSSIVEVTISGAGKCFSAGGDLTEFGTTPDPATAHAVRSVRSPPAMLARCAERVRFRVHGAAIGAGVELAAFGRRVEATPETFFQLPEIRFGLIAGSGGCVSIPRRIGRQRTAYLALSARRLDANTALAWGLIDGLIESVDEPEAVNESKGFA